MITDPLLTDQKQQQQLAKTYATLIKFKIFVFAVYTFLYTLIFLAYFGMIAVADLTSSPAGCLTYSLSECLSRPSGGALNIYYDTWLSAVTVTTFFLLAIFIFLECVINHSKKEHIIRIFATVFFVVVTLIKLLGLLLAVIYKVNTDNALHTTGAYMAALGGIIGSFLLFIRRWILYTRKHLFGCSIYYCSNSMTFYFFFNLTIFLLMIAFALVFVIAPSPGYGAYELLLISFLLLDGYFQIYDFWFKLSLTSHLNSLTPPPKIAFTDHPNLAPTHDGVKKGRGDMTDEEIRINNLKAVQTMPEYLISSEPYANRESKKNLSVYNKKINAYE